jgi:long-chain acyl-CoA synthetase
MHAFASLPQLIDSACARFGSRPAYQQGSATLSYAVVDELARRFAAWLQQTCGLQPGERIALMMPNVLAYPIALVGALRAGLVVVNCNPLYTARELQYQLVDSGAVAIVAFESTMPLVRQVRGATALRRVIVAGLRDLHEGTAGTPAAVASGEDRFPSALSEGARLTSSVPAIAAEGLAFLQYTGGTTGVSKGAMLSHSNVVANVLQGAAWYADALGAGDAVAVSVIPLYHTFGMTFNGLLMLHCGALNRLVANPRDATQLRAAMAPGFTVIAGVNTLFNTLLDLPELQDVDYTSLRLTVSGGAATQPVVAQRWLRATGCGVTEGYGLTETSPFALSNPVHLGMAGGLMPLPSTEVAIRADDGTVVPTGMPGEICIRGPQVMQGYWRQPAETAAALDAQGWLRTGDIGTMDGRGAVSVTDRKKDMVLVSGFNVFPNEVEAVLASHPAVAECAVVGVADSGTGEALKAFVVARRNSVSSEALIEHCRAALAAYKVPRQFAFVDQLPKSPVGKILRRELRSRTASTG